MVPCPYKQPGPTKAIFEVWPFHRSVYEKGRLRLGRSICSWSDRLLSPCHTLKHTCSQTASCLTQMTPFLSPRLLLSIISTLKQNTHTIAKLISSEESSSISETPLLLVWK